MSEKMNTPDPVDILSAPNTSSPHALLRRLREQGPVQWSSRHRAWIVSGYQAVADGFRDPRLSSDRLRPLREQLSPERQAAVGDTLRLLESWLVFQDAPEHKRLRGVIQKAFTPATIASMAPEITRLSKREIAKVNSRLEEDPSSVIDVLNEVAYELPGYIICKMLGVSEEDRQQFVSWTEEISSVIGGFADDPDRYERTHEAVKKIEAYLTGIIENGKAAPGGLLDKLLEAEADGERLTRHEVIATSILILFGGNRTTSCMIANSTRALLLHPEQLGMLLDDPSMINAAIEEILRWEGHTKFTVRIAGEDFTWEGKDLKKGDRVFLSPLGANRDPAMFEDPDRLDFQRKNASRHIAFGYGVHLCLGLSLAKLELRTFLSEFLSSLPHLALVNPDSSWERSIVSRVQKQLLVTSKSAADDPVSLSSSAGTNTDSRVPSATSTG